MSSVALRLGGVLDARPRAAALLVPFAALANLVVAVVLVQRGAGVAAALTVVPTILLLFGSLVVSNRMFLVLGGLVTGLTLPFLNRALPLPLGRPVFVADLLVVGALGAWLTSRLLGDSTRARLPGTPVLGLPLVLFSLTVISGMLRGHERYGASLFGQPSRLIVYAAIGLAVAQLEARRLYHALVAVFYGGTIWMLLNAVYYMATGQSQTDQSALTTGGTRILAQGVAEFIAGSLFLSLLNLELDQVARRRALHMAIAGLSLFEIVLAFGRTTFAALAVVLPILCILFKKIRGALVVMIPLLVPFLILTALLLPKATPQLKQTFVERITKSRANDPSYQWRVKARAAVWPQVKESPLIGVGFGRSTTFTDDRAGSAQQLHLAVGKRWDLKLGRVLPDSGHLRSRRARAAPRHDGQVRTYSDRLGDRHGVRPAGERGERARLRRSDPATRDLDLARFAGRCASAAAGCEG
jgi:hypothetical protein